MTDCFEIEASRAVQLIDRDPSRAVPVLIGCSLYFENDEDTLLTISNVDLGARHFLCRYEGKERRVPFRSSRFWVIDERETLPLKVVEESLRSSTEVEAARARRQLANYLLLSPNMADDHAIELAAVIMEQGLPDRARRYGCFNLFKLYGLERQALPVVLTWVKTALASGRADYDGPIQLAYLYRHSGQLAEAINWADLRCLAPLQPTEHQKAILLTERAAILLDLHEQASPTERHAGKLLDEADRCARRGWAIEPSEELSAVFKRMKRIRGKDS